MHQELSEVTTPHAGTGLQNLMPSQIPYFFDQMPRLLFISLLILCGYYSKAAFITLDIDNTYHRWM